MSPYYWLLFYAVIAAFFGVPLVWRCGQLWREIVRSRFAKHVFLALAVALIGFAVWWFSGMHF